MGIQMSIVHLNFQSVNMIYLKYIIIVIMILLFLLSLLLIYYFKEISQV